MRATWWIGVMALVAWTVSGGAAGGEERTLKAPAAREAPPAVKVEAKRARVNVNEASKTELMALDGVGAALAQKIVAYRETHGPFKRVEDLAKVEGVGKAVLERNAGRITVR